MSDESPSDLQLQKGGDPPPDSAQVFRPRANRFYMAFVVFIPIALFVGGFSWYQIYRSPIWTDVSVAVAQPVMFSHRHHAGELQIDCRYCHTSATTSSFAGFPPTETCMTCHSQVFKQSQLLKPVLVSFNTNQPIHWNRVHNLPDYVYFNHSIHVNKGIGCATCHGKVNEMPLVSKDQTLFMEWCLQCHRNPEPNLRPIAQTFNMDWRPPNDQSTQGPRLARAYHLHTAHLTDCTVCHR